ncbi:MAG: hypothetical protein HQM08_19495 [Candidatus Riflebacteria bacterium]|nr:hypothetical protein [Candidatus Riflebacteria bacterium]
MLRKYRRIVLLFFFLFFVLVSLLSIVTAASDLTDLSNEELIEMIFNPKNNNLFLYNEDPKTSEAYLNNLKRPKIAVKDFVAGCCDAMADFRLSSKKIFKKATGSYDKKLSYEEFMKLAGENLLPISTNPANYFRLHDKNKDGSLDLCEFVPSPREIAEEVNLIELTEHYLRNQEYKKGMKPVFSPVPSTDSLKITLKEIEQRILKFAKEKNLKTRYEKNILQLLDETENPIAPLPKGILPSTFESALVGLRLHANKNDLTFKFEAGGLPQLVKKTGEIVPVEEWPKEYQPPYLPSDSVYK